MTPLSGDAVRAVDDLSVHDDAAAHTGADDRTEHDGRARSRAISRLGHREAIRVVGDADWPPHRDLDIMLKAMADQPRRVRVLHEACGRSDRPGNADADGCAAGRVQLINEASDRHDGLVVVAARCAATLIGVQPLARSRLPDADGARVVAGGNQLAVPRNGERRPEVRV